MGSGNRVQGPGPSPNAPRVHLFRFAASLQASYVRNPARIRLSVLVLLLVLEPERADCSGVEIGHGHAHGHENWISSCARRECGARSRTRTRTTVMADARPETRAERLNVPLGRGRQEDEGVGNLHVASFVGDAWKSPLADVAQDGALEGWGAEGRENQDRFRDLA
jgi:hypothetical protein